MLTHAVTSDPVYEFAADVRAGLSLPVDRIGLYDPAVSIDGGFPAGWVDAFGDAVRAGDHARAMTVMSREVYADDLTARLPFD